MKRAALIAFFLVLAALWFRYGFPLVQTKYMEGNDFLVFYAGGKLAFSRELYNPEAVKAVQLRFAGMTDPALPFNRLPYLGAVYWPLAQLPFATAAAVWQTLSLAALIGFLALWRPPPPNVSILVDAVFMPVAVALLNGQDINFLLLFIALCYRDLRRGREFRAGVWLSLCVAKYHLFPFFIVFVVAPRLWRFGAGAAAGVTAALIACFAVNGFDWPVRYA